MIPFTNPETEALYELLLEKDQNIWIPECRSNGRCYEGPMSGMPPEAAEKYISLNGKWVRRRETVVPPADVETETPPADTGEEE